MLTEPFLESRQALYYAGAVHALVAANHIVNSMMDCTDIDSAAQNIWRHINELHEHLLFTFKHNKDRIAEGFEKACMDFLADVCGGLAVPEEVQQEARILFYAGGFAFFDCAFVYPKFAKMTAAQGKENFHALKEELITAFEDTRKEKDVQ